MNKIELPDLNEIDKIAGGDNGFRNEMIAIFLDQIPEFLNNMRHFFDRNDFANLAREAHTAKSSVLIFGMTETGKLLKEIQIFSEDHLTDTIPQLLSEIENNLNAAKNNLRDILNLQKTSGC